MKRLHSLRLLLLICLMCFFVKPLAAQTIHAVLVSDQAPWAEWGKHAPNLTADSTMMFAALYNNIPESQLNFMTLPIEEDAYSSPENIRSLIAEMQPGPQDTYLFYFTGHGAHDDRGHYLQLAQGKLYRDEIKQLMESKGARLNVLITDCCNVRSDGQMFFAPAPMLNPPNSITPLFRSLFIANQGWVDINGSSPGQGAYFTRDVERLGYGSLFTSELTSFWDKHQRQSVTWDFLVREVGLRVSVAFKTQYPAGVAAAKGMPAQTEQNVYAVAYPGMPENRGPRTGLTIRDYDGRGALIISVRPGFPGEQVYNLQTKQYVALRPQQLIVSANGQAITGANQFVEVVQASPQIMRLGIMDGARESEYLMRLRY